MRVEIEEVRGRRERGILERLYPLYLHDLSSFTSHFRLDGEGRWRPDYLDDWMGREECSSLLIRADGTPAGFAFVAERPFPHMEPDAEHKVVEFFVARPFRRAGVGTEAARRVIGARPGAWQLDVIVANEGAHAFWRTIAPDAVEKPDHARGALVVRFIV